MSDVTQLLNAVEAGEPKAADRLLPLVYEELRKLAVARMANEKVGQTLQPTALHEARVPESRDLSLPIFPFYRHVPTGALAVAGSKKYSKTCGVIGRRKTPWTGDRTNQALVDGKTKDQ